MSDLTDDLENDLGIFEESVKCSRCGAVYRETGFGCPECEAKSGGEA